MPECDSECKRIQKEREEVKHLQSDMRSLIVIQFKILPPHCLHAELTTLIPLSGKH